MKKTLVLLLFSGLVFSLSAQVNKDVKVSRTYDPIVVDAQKIWHEPTTIVDSAKVNDVFSYSIFPKSGIGNFGLSPIASARIERKDYDNRGLGYVRAALGYKLSPLLDFYINNKNTEKTLVGFYANHRSFWGDIELSEGDIKKDVKGDFMNNHLGAFSKFIFRGSTLTFNADYSRKNLRLYGFDPSILSNSLFSFDENNKRVFNLFNVNALLKSDADKGTLFYSLGASFQLFNGNNRFEGKLLKENALSFSGEIGASLADHRQSLSLATRYTMYERNNELEFEGRNALVSANPSWKYTDDLFNVKLGVQYLIDDNQKTNKQRFYPAVLFSYKLHDYFIPSIEVKGETEVNSFRKFSEENPYLNFEVFNTSGARNTNHKLIASFSIKGDIEKFSYNVFALYSKVDYLPLFVNTRKPFSALNYDGNVFDVHYAKGEKKSLGAELSYTDAAFTIYAKMVYNKYSLKLDEEVLEHAWHKPRFETNFNVRYKVADDLVLTADFRALSGLYALSYKGFGEEVRRLKNVFDLGLGAEILFTSRFTGFVNVSNLLNQKYDTYSRYRVPGFIASVGLTYRF